MVTMLETDRIFEGMTVEIDPPSGVYGVVRRHATELAPGQQWEIAGPDGGLFYRQAADLAPA